MPVGNLPSGHTFVGSETQAIADKLNNLNNSFSRYLGTTTALASGAWTALTWPTLSEGTGLGLSLASSTTFTLTMSGIWTVHFTGVSGNAGTGTLYGLFADNTFTSGTIYAEGQSPLQVSQTAMSLAAEISSTGTTTLLVGVWGVGGAPAMTTAGTTPRLTFSCKPA